MYLWWGNLDGMKRKCKECKDSLVTMTEMVLPNDTNTLNNLMGGRLMHWMDIVSAISAQRHSNSVVVTASVDNISFSKPIPLGNVVTLEAFVTRAFKSSMEVFITVKAEDIPDDKKVGTHTAFFTFVAVDQNGQPKIVPDLIPKTEKEHKYYAGALRRRQLRLLLGGRIKIDKATELKDYINAQNP